MNRSLPGSSIHGICLARVLEWVAIASSPTKYSIGQNLVSKQRYLQTKVSLEVASSQPLFFMVSGADCWPTFSASLELLSNIMWLLIQWWVIHVYTHTFKHTFKFLQIFLHVHTHTLKTYPMRLVLKKIELENISNLFLGLEKTARTSESQDICVIGTVAPKMSLGWLQWMILGCT